MLQPRRERTRRHRQQPGPGASTVMPQPVESRKADRWFAGSGLDVDAVVSGQARQASVVALPYGARLPTRSTDEQLPPGMAQQPLEPNSP
jgi:hypothetical protein